MNSKGFLVAVAIFITFLGCQHRQLSSVPEDLIGVWKTAERKYSDRYFELKKDRIIFATGGWGVTAHPIDRIEERRENGNLLYIIYYPNGPGDEIEFSFYYDPTQRVIRFKNQEQFEWIKWGEVTPTVKPSYQNDPHAINAS
ncbi:MAG: hypothetical protein O7G29_12790 [Acidobacteria bacterium]|nr:hypothetical protein [Acidobacteriota bacterium]